MKHTLTREDAEAYLEGARLYGTGGGGEMEWGKAIMENDFTKGRIYNFVSPEDVPDNSFICSGGIMGSVATLGGLSYDEIIQEWETRFPLVEAIRTMERLNGRKVDYLIPFETGGLNGPVIFSVAARLGIPCIDGDGVGRAAPETQMCSFIGNGVDLYPMPVVDRNGNVSVILHSDVPTYADEVGRFIVLKGGGMAANAHYPMSGAVMKKACVSGMVTKTLDIGRAIIQTSSAADVIQKILQSEDGARILFSGAVSRIEGVDRGGFYLTDLDLEGTDQYASSKAKMIIKNETMVFWVDEKVRCIFPDLALIMDPDTGKGIPTISLKKGMELIVLGVPCPSVVAKALLSDKGQLAFNPSRYGCDTLDYAPFCQLNDIG